MTATDDRLGTRRAVEATNGGLAERPYARLATIAAISLSVLLPTIELSRTALAPEAYGNPLVALVATACALPLHEAPAPERESSPPRSSMRSRPNVSRSTMFAHQSFGSVSQTSAVSSALATRFGYSSAGRLI